jgi:sigma-B regulation protein RsbU (phosphoserine phosphatase)
MPRPARALLRVLAVLFAAATTLYSVLWIQGATAEASAQLGVESRHDRASAAQVILLVVPGAPAERAGLAAGDRVKAVNGRPVTSDTVFFDPLFHGRPGESVSLLVERGGDRLTLTPVLGAPRERPAETGTRRVVEQILSLYPVLFLLVAVGVVTSRPDDRNAWLLALVFGGFIAAAPLFELTAPPGLRGFAVAYKVVLYGITPGVFLYFFSTFPAASPIDRRLPRLKAVWLAAGVAVCLPGGIWALAAGSSDPLRRWADALPAAVGVVVALYYFGGTGLGLASLVANAFRGSPPVRRKSRVIGWGMVFGLLPMLLLFAVATVGGRDVYAFPFWVWASCVIMMFLVPLSFSYAVLKHRVLELPVLLKRSARYLLVQRGSIGLLVLLGAASTMAFASSLAGQLRPRTEAAVPAAIGLGTAFGSVLVWAGWAVRRRLRERIDRAFFRAAYDARHILQDLAERAREAGSQAELAALLDHHVRSALLPRSLTVYLESGPGRLAALRGVAPAGMETLAPSLPALADLARRGHPYEVPPAGAGVVDYGALAPLDPDCVVPILGRGGRLTGLLVLGPRLSDEPYSREDKRLLASVASQAAITLDGIHLAEQMAARIEAERRAAHEMELAQAVQRRFLPDRAPALATLECAGRCIQARAVGGDYYDFLELGAGRVGLVLADVSGKGFPAALVMANLQASLRSRSLEDLANPARQLRSVNQLLYRASEANRYATLFLGLYDDATRRLCYANCGHNPPIVLRADGQVERLAPTAPVLGLIEEWECTTGQAFLAPGDLLALYTDGVTEAFSDDDEEFGEQRLIAVLEAHRHAPVGEIVDAVTGAVGAFSGSEQDDDLTVVVARAR